eukprot:15440921-Alexandrium_andersonii.AAC.1
MRVSAASRWQRFGAVPCTPPAPLSLRGSHPPGPPKRRPWRAPEALCGGGPEGREPPPSESGVGGRRLQNAAAGAGSQEAA